MTCKHQALTFLGAFLSDAQTGTATRPLRAGEGLTHAASHVPEQGTVLQRAAEEQNSGPRRGHRAHNHANSSRAAARWVLG